jgi:hypothetical protein
MNTQPTPKELQDLDDKGAYIPPWFPESAYEAVP